MTPIEIGREAARTKRDREDPAMTEGDAELRIQSYVDRAGLSDLGGGDMDRALASYFATAREPLRLARCAHRRH